MVYKILVAILDTLYTDFILRSAIAFLIVNYIFAYVMKSDVTLNSIGHEVTSNKKLGQHRH